MNRLVLLGTGCPAPSHKRFGPSTLLEINGKRYLFDTGSGVTQRLNELGLKSSDIDLVFITHMHSDHIVDLYQLYISGWHQGRNKPFKIIGPVGIKHFFIKQLESYFDELKLRKEYEMRPNEVGLDYEIIEIDDDFKLDNKNLSIKPFYVDHAPVNPAYGFKINFKKNKTEKSIVISGDTKKSENLIKEALNSDILVHELFVDLEMDEKRMTLETVKNVSKYHTTPKDVGDIASQSNTKNLVLTHFVPPNFDEEKVLSEIKQYYEGNIYIGYDLFTIEI